VIVLFVAGALLAVVGLIFGPLIRLALSAAPVSRWPMSAA